MGILTERQRRELDEYSPLQHQATYGVGMPGEGGDLGQGMKVVVNSLPETIGHLRSMVLRGETGKKSTRRMLGLALSELGTIARVVDGAERASVTLRKLGRELGRR